MFVGAGVICEEIILGQGYGFAEGAVKISVKINFDFGLNSVEIFLRNTIGLEPRKSGFNRWKQIIQIRAGI